MTNNTEIPEPVSRLEDLSDKYRRIIPALFVAAKRQPFYPSKKLPSQRADYRNFEHMPVIRDQYGRTFSTLRVSLVSHCNLGCVYCVAGDDTVRAAPPGRLSVSD